MPKGKKYAYVPITEAFGKLSRGARLTWVGLCIFAKWEGGVGRCFPSQGTLEKWVGLSERAIRSAINELRRAGFLSWEKHGRTLHYTLIISGQTGSSFRSDRKHLPPNYNTITNPDNSLTPEQGERLFEALWAQYRRYNPAGRAEARRALRRLFPVGTPLDEVKKREETLINLLNGQGGTWEERLERGEGRYIPKMANWLQSEFDGVSREAAA